MRISSRAIQAAILSVLATTSATGLAQAAGEQPLQIDIPAQSLAEALKALAEQGDLQIVFAAESVKNHVSPHVVGQMDVARALQLLLQGTELEYVFTGQAYVVRSRKREPQHSAPAGDFTSRVPTAGGMHAAGLSQARERVELEEVVVTGSHIRGLTSGSTSPVITFDREELARGGYVATQDVFAKLPQNFSGFTTATGMQTGYYTTNQIDLRGLGAESTLTLVNGRRVSRAAGAEGRSVDISMIPVSAIERIDVLTDGASALYGSDAVAGVVNIVLRRDFEGAETSLHYTENSADASGYMVSQVFGTSWQSGRVLIAGQYDEHDALSYRGLGVTTSDLRSRGGGDYRYFGLGSPGTVYSAGFFAGAPFTSLTGPNGEPVYSVALPAGDGRNLQIGDLALNETTFTDILMDDLSPQTESASAYLTVEQELGPVTLFADAVASRRRYELGGMGPVAYLFVPESNAFSPFDEPVLVAYQMEEFNRPSSWENTGWLANLGARGAIGSSDWTWEIVGTLSRDESDGASLAYDTQRMNERLASADPAVAFNPFGDGSGQSPGVVDELLTRRFTKARTAAEQVTALTQGSLLQLPAGALRLALGAQYRNDEMETLRGGEGLVTETRFALQSQRSRAVFAEAYVPLAGGAISRPGLHELGLSAAARYEDYDVFGSTFDPKLGLLWRPHTDLVVKTNWGTSFRAPSLRELYYPANVNNNVSIFDPRAPGGARNVFARLVLGGNPNLEPETADTFTIGAEYRPAWLPGARLSIYHYRTDYEKRVRGSGDGLTQELLLEFEDSLPPGVVVRDEAGNLVQISTAYVNSARTKLAGYDFSAGYTWAPGRWGSFDLSLAGTLMDTYEDQIVPGAPIQEQAGAVGWPAKWRGRAALSWSLQSWTASITVQHIDGLTVIDTDPRIVDRSVSSQTTTDVQVGYTPRNAESALLRGLSVRAGANNVFDEPSPFVDGPYNFGLGTQNFVIEGRSLYLRLTKAFGAAAR